MLFAEESISDIESLVREVEEEMRPDMCNFYSDVESEHEVVPDQNEEVPDQNEEVPAQVEEAPAPKKKRSRGWLCILVNAYVNYGQDFDAEAFTNLWVSHCKADYAVG